MDNDYNAGRIMDALEKPDTLDDTAIVLGEWRSYDKRFMREPSIRVPCAFRYPRRIKAGLTPREMAPNIDIPSTILELASVKTAEFIQKSRILCLQVKDAGDAENPKLNLFTASKAFT